MPGPAPPEVALKLELELAAALLQALPLLLALGLATETLLLLLLVAEELEQALLEALTVPPSLPTPLLGLLVGVLLAAEEAVAPS